MFGIIRVSQTDYFRNGSGSSDPNRPKVLKITVPYHMELGGVFKMAPSSQPPAPARSVRLAEQRPRYTDSTILRL
mgnify:CR=1 FL=1